MKILLGGGTGFIGNALNKKLTSTGHSVITISRSPKGKDQVSWNDVSKNGIPDGVNAVANLAGRTIAELSPMFYFGNNYESFKKDIFTSRLETTKTLQEAIKSCKHPIDSFVTASAISYYKPDPVKDYTESSSFEEYSYLTRLCKEWEEAAKIKEKPEIRQIQVRIGVVLGRGGGMVASLYPSFFMGLGGPVGSGKQWLPWIHLDDIVGIFHHALTNSNVSSGPLNGTAPNPVTNAQFTKAFASALGRPAVLPLFPFVVRAMFNDRAELMLEGQKVFPKRTLETGYKFHYTDVKDACNSLFK